MEPGKCNTYISVILPIKYRGEITYLVPDRMAGSLVVGSRVGVDFAGKEYVAVVEKIMPGEDFAGISGKDGKEILYKEILSVENDSVAVPEEAIRLWHQVADYYLCTVGEVYKAAYPNMVQRQEGVKSRKTAEHFFKSVQENLPELPQLSGCQKEAFDKIMNEFSFPIDKALRANSGAGKGRPVLLDGVTGSGKTEIYINLAARELGQGKSVLLMVPEIAITKQLQSRLKKVFGERLLVFHSKQTIAEKARIHKIVSRQFLAEYVNQCKSDNGETGGLDAPDDAVVVLGTRSALFLPYYNLGLIVVDEEHDSSYKQTEPSPRYQARDVAIMLARIHSANVLLGSATPSFESEYNCRIGRFEKVCLNERFYGAQSPEVDIIDTIWARKSRQMKGSFSQKLINEIQKVLDRGRQVIIFRNRRSYSPIVECAECGEIPKCKHCNVYLSYHKYDNTLRCHYCDYTERFTGVCHSCGLDTLRYKGAGTERIEEELKELFPNRVCARFDADIAQSKREEERILKAFAAKEIDILVGTQMIGKGFDFEYLDLVAVLQADTILGIQDFRADEKAMQVFSQLMGRTGRRDTRGKIMIQTNQKDHPVFEQLRRGVAAVGNNHLTQTLLEERREFRFAPFVRMVKIVVKHKDGERLNLLCTKVEEALRRVPCIEVTGPFVPAIDKVRGEFLKCFYIKFARNQELVANKQKLLKAIESIKAPNSIFIDVDPA